MYVGSVNPRSQPAQSLGASLYVSPVHTCRSTVKPSLRRLVVLACVCVCGFSFVCL